MPAKAVRFIVLRPPPAARRTARAWTAGPAAALRGVTGWDAMQISTGATRAAARCGRLKRLYTRWQCGSIRP